jgi:sialate O-acetylesterase
VLIIPLLAQPSCVHADVKLNGLFTTGAVLQCEKRIPIWGTAADGERVTVAIRDFRASVTAKGGRWTVYLPPMPPGGPYSLTVLGRTRIVLKNIVFGEVYLCVGQSNMEWPVSLSSGAAEALLESRDPMLRLYTVPRAISDTPLTDVSAAWQPSTPESARGFSAVAYYFGRSLRSHLGRPVGLIQSAWSATTAQSWTSRLALTAHTETAPLIAVYERDKEGYVRALDEFMVAREVARANGEADPPSPANPTGQGSPSTVYNAMIAPLAPFALRGIISYQGESNTEDPKLYRTLFPAMIESWRAAFGDPSLPVLFVQLAPFLKRSESPRESAWAELRDAQLEVSQTVASTGMVVTIDVGDEYDIHPRDKQTVGERLERLARVLVYGQNVEASGPVFDSMTVDSNKAILHFTHIGGGLETHDSKALTGFTIAGADGKYLNASAVIQGDTVIVSAPGVDYPVNVRYGWADYPEGNLWNRAGLPASPFRTDRPPPLKRVQSSRFKVHGLSATTLQL